MLGNKCIPKMNTPKGFTSKCLINSRTTTLNYLQYEEITNTPELVFCCKKDNYFHF